MNRNLRCLMFSLFMFSENAFLWWLKMAKTSRILFSKYRNSYLYAIFIHCDGAKQLFESKSNAKNKQNQSVLYKWTSSFICRFVSRGTDSNTRLFKFKFCRLEQWISANVKTKRPYLTQISSFGVQILPWPTQMIDLICGLLSHYFETLWVPLKGHSIRIEPREPVTDKNTAFPSD